MRFELRGPLRDVLCCHCDECRRWHGHFAASTAVRRDDLLFLSRIGLRWIDSPHSDARARRGFCTECGSSLFWDPPDGELISVAAGCLEPPTRLRIAGHWFVEQAGDYYQLPDDGAPRYPRSGESPAP